MASGFSESKPVSGDTKPQLLVALQEVLTQWEIEHQWLHPTSEVPFYGLIARFYLLEGMGMDWTFSLIPKMHDSEEFVSQEILQLFMEVKPDLQSDYLHELFKQIAKINLNLPFGAFGVDLDLRTLYFKHNTLINMKGDLEISLDMLQNQWGIILYSLNLFVPSLLAVAAGELTSEEAWIDPSSQSSL
ncbi:hypothetical protein [Roseofilum casamattae]|nr:hypothetical protein [Roseofilum casamattae]